MELKHIATRSGRLSTFLKQELGLSTGLMNKLKWSEKLFVNGIPRHADFCVEIGDVITANLDEPTPDYPAEDGDFTILYEDDHLLVVDKPAGMLIHPSRSRLTGTLANRVLGYFQRTGQKCAYHPITRLDRDTFGIVLLAKNAHIHGILTGFQTEGKIQKFYHALVFGAPESENGIIDAPIARQELPSLLRYVTRMANHPAPCFLFWNDAAILPSWSCSPLQAVPISFVYTAPIWDIRFWAIPSTAARPLRPFPKKWD